MTPRPRRTNGLTSGHGVAYLRVSTDEQGVSGLGLEAQAHAIHQAAQRAGLELRSTFIEAGVSGGAPIEKRPELIAALAALRRGDVLIVAKRDRLARDVVNAALIEAATKRKSARVISAAGEGTDDDTPSNILMRTIIDAFASYERLLIGARTSAALKAKAKRGERVSRHAPYGYAFNPENRVEPDNAEQQVLAIMVECRDAGFSFEGIAWELNRLHHRTRNGQPWRWQYVHTILARQPAAPDPDAHA